MEMHERKYEIVDNRLVKRSNKVPISAEEPLFIFRAKDRKALLALVAYNMVLQTAPFRVAEPRAEPFDSSSFDHYHWHMELLPRVAMLAGFEYGTGDYINTVFPETAAATLRENLRSGITS